MKSTVSNLKPDETVFRFLFESPSHFVGECDADDFYLSPAFKTWGNNHLRGSQQDGSNIAFSIRVEPAEQKSICLERYEWIGEDISALLSIFYGKLIYNLGQFESAGNFFVPARMMPLPFVPQGMAFNNTVRKPDGPELNLFEARNLITWYLALGDDSDLSCLLRAAEFYRLGLETFRSQPHISLAMFCSALEAILPLKNYSEEELFDGTLIAIFRRIGSQLRKGNKVVNGIKGRLFQIKRRVAAFADEFMPDSFFLQRETSLSYGTIKDRSDLIHRLKNTYDIRSKILHTGDLSGLWYLARSHDDSEIGFGQPVISNDELKRTLVESMTLAGLERVSSTLFRTVLIGKVASYCPDSVPEAQSAPCV